MNTIRRLGEETKTKNQEGNKGLCISKDIQKKKKKKVIC